MVRYDCRVCGENVFDVVDIEHLGTLPHTWTCSGCQRVYVGELDDAGNLIVYQRGYKRSAKVFKSLALVEPTPAPPAEEPSEGEPAPAEETGGPVEDESQEPEESAEEAEE